MNEVTVKQNSLAVSNLSDWGAPPELTKSDILIPKANIMQMMSKKVINGEAVFGEIRESLNNKFLGNLLQPMNFIPFWMEKNWVEFEVLANGKRGKYKGSYPITRGNEDLGYAEPGIERDRCMNFYVLDVSDIDASKTGGGTIPLIISFRRTSINGGKKLSTQMYAANAAAGLSPAAMVCSLVVSKVSNDNGTFAVSDVKTSRQSTPEEISAALYWFKKARGNEIVADDSDLVAEAGPSHQAPDSTPF